MNLLLTLVIPLRLLEKPKIDCDIKGIKIKTKSDYEVSA